MIRGRGLKKTPGCSMIEVDGKANEFVSGDVVHSHQVKICAMLDLLSAEGSGFLLDNNIPVTNF